MKNVTPPLNPSAGLGKNQASSLNVPSFLGKGEFKPAKEIGPPVRDLNTLSEDELLALKDEIEARLPARSLKDMNLEEELVSQYMRVKSLQTRVLDDEGIPTNQVAQVAAQVASTLQQLVKMQTDFHTAERFKKLEGFMIKHMKNMPLDLAEKFLDDYEKLAEKE